MEALGAFITFFAALFSLATSSILYIYFGLEFVGLTTGNLIAIGIFLYLLARAYTKKHFHQLSSITKVIMVLGIMSMILV